MQTSNQEPDFKMKALKSGVDCLAEKPVNEANLAASLVHLGFVEKVKGEAPAPVSKPSTKFIDLERSWSEELASRNKKEKTQKPKRDGSRYVESDGEGADVSGV